LNQKYPNRENGKTEKRGGEGDDFNESKFSISYAVIAIAGHRRIGRFREK